MLTFIVLLEFFITALAAPTDVEYYDNVFPPKCTGGIFDEYTIDDFIVRNLNVNFRLQLLKGVEKLGTTMPKGKVMKALQNSFWEWDCDLEKQAIDALAGSCPNEKPHTPANQTGYFYKLDIGIQLDILTAMDAWTDEKKKVTMAVDSTAVKYKDSGVANYLNFMRSSATKIGCADHTCHEGNTYKYRAYCITNAPPLKNGDIIYEIGNGGCLKGDTCPSESTCVTFGLCKDK